MNKKKIAQKVLIIITICLFSLVGLRFIQGAAPTGGVAYWNFDEGAGTAANDSWGTNTGTVNGATWVTGKYGSALSFNGTSSYVSIGKTDIATPWTAAMWVNRTNDTGAASDSLMGSASGALKLEQYNGTKEVGYTKYGTSDYTFSYTAPTGTWVHLAFVGVSSGVSLYVNGVLQGTNSGVINCPMSFIGCGKSGVDYLWGMLDDVKIYNRALSAQEILNLYNNITPSPTPAVTPTPTTTPTPTVTPTPTPTTTHTGAPSGGVSYWSFNENSGTAAHDSWGSNNGTVNGVTWVAGVSGSALSFNGTSNYVSIGAADIAPPWTATMWVNRTNSSASSDALMGSVNGALKLEQYNGTKEVGYTKYGTGDYTFNYTAPIGTWVYLTFVGTSSGVSLYVNGALQANNSAIINCPMSGSVAVMGPGTI